MQDVEFQLIEKVLHSKTPIEREQWLIKLASTPVDMYPFYDRWMRINEVYPFECWTEQDYDPSRSSVPRDLQLLAASIYAKSDIDNGGFHQFFSNGTGVCAPELAEWLELAKLPEAAMCVRKAMEKFGPSYPRKRENRSKILEGYAMTGRREEWDPFAKLDEEFYESLAGNEGDRFCAVADRWLADNCGIRLLGDQPHWVKPNTGN